jgi:hypothetical protein
LETFHEAENQSVKVELITFFWRFEGRKITLPEKFLPSKEFLSFHHNNVFKA